MTAFMGWFGPRGLALVVFKSEDGVRTWWSNPRFKDLSACVGFPPTVAEFTIVDLPAIAAPL